MYKIKLRGDTKARWESANPVLALREVGLETDTKKLKIGDGISVYSALMYAGGNIQSLVEGEGITIDYTDPANPIISSTGGGGGVVYDVYDDVFIETNTIPLKINDVKILRKIRDTNPGSQLDTIFNEDLDPYTAWFDTNSQRGALFGSHPDFNDVMSNIGLDIPTQIDPYRCYFIAFQDCGLTTLNITPISGYRGLENLLYLKCELNSLTTLDLTTAIKLESVYCNSGGSLSTLLLPPSIINVICYGNSIESLDFAHLDNLDRVECNSNMMLSLSGIHGNISYLACQGNGIHTLDLQLSNLSYLDCSSNVMSSLNLSGLPSLESLNCSDNILTNINVSTLSSLSYLNCGNNNLTSIDISGMANMDNLVCDNNALTQISLVGAYNLRSLSCSHNNLSASFSSLISEVTKLEYSRFYWINCAYNNLVSIDISASRVYDFHLDCSHNQLTNIIISAATFGLYCSYNNLTSLSFSYLVNSGLYFLDCSFNQLDTLDLRKSTGGNIQNVIANDNLLTYVYRNNGYMAVMNYRNNHLTVIDARGVTPWQMSYNFQNNYLPPAEVTRLTNMGFNSYFINPQIAP